MRLTAWLDSPRGTRVHERSAEEASTALAPAGQTPPRTQTSGNSGGFGSRLADARRVHVVGAGGAGMSAIATVLVEMGYSVTGSDASDSPSLQRLGRLGVAVAVGSTPEMAVAADVVVLSTAVPDSDADVTAARDSGTPVWSRADLLAAICSLKRTIAVSGTHGKTTTTAMIAITLDRLGWKPSWIVGSEIVGLGPGGRWDPDGEWLVVEADESDGTFTRLDAQAVVVTNVEADHLEFYGDVGRLEDEFTRFASPSDGLAVLCADDPGALRVAARVDGAARAVLTYGTSLNADFAALDVEMHSDGSDFRVQVPARAVPLAGGREVESEGRPDDWDVVVHLAVPGLHNVRNAAAAVAVGAALGAPIESLGDAIGAFKGVARRFQSRGSAAGVSFVDGYDHLPSEVAAAIATARLGNWSRVVAVFQPHRYSRTEALWSQFADSFEGADVVVIAGIYPAGEKPRPGVDENLIAEAVQRSHPDVEIHRAGTLRSVASLLAELLQPGDLCLTLGAGDITEIPDMVMASFDAVGRR